MKQEEDILKTDDFMGVMGICQTCIETVGFGLIIGRSGFGKTYSLRKFAKQDKVIYLECHECMNVRDIIKMIEERLHITHYGGSINDGMQCVKDFFNENPGYLLIIDEADKLCSKFTQKKLETIRNIYDDSNVAIVLSGEPKLKETIQKYIERSSSRIDVAYELKGLRKAEVIEYLSNYNFTEEAIEEMIRRATNGRNGCFRLLNRTFQNILRLCETGQTIDLSTVETASGMMMI